MALLGSGSYGLKDTSRSGIRTRRRWFAGGFGALLVLLVGAAIWELADGYRWAFRNSPRKVNVTLCSLTLMATAATGLLLWQLSSAQH